MLNKATLNFMALVLVSSLGTRI